MRATPLLALLALLALALASRSAAQDASAGVPLTAVILGDDAGDRVARLLEEELALPLDVEVVPLPEVAPAPPDVPIVDVASARAHYVSADPSACLAIVGDPAALELALRTGDRALAARLLFWQAACALSAGDDGAARAAATRLAVLDLRFPPDVDSVTPDVERLLVDVGQATRRGARAAIAIDARAGETSIAADARVDGRGASCRTPCAVEVWPGLHLVEVAADGHVPEQRWVEVDASGASLTLELTPASPALAARQWAERYGRAQDIDDDLAVVLLGRAVPSPRLLLVSVQQLELGGVYLEDGALRARGRRDGTSDDDVRALVRLLLERAEVLEPAPEVWETPELWIVVAVVAAVAGGLIGWALYEPPVRTELTWGPAAREPGR